jgi:hypothetical protein
MRRETTWLAMVVEAEPDFYRISRIVPEYEFQSPAVHGYRGEVEPLEGGFTTYENGKRVFYGDYKTRGPYKK